jgi:hypothetical protein
LATRPPANPNLRSDRQGKLLDRDTRPANDCAQCRFCNFPVIREQQAPIRRDGLAQNKVAAVLAVEFVACLL